jgi:3-demethylubiquinone-9 3-methyltransferase
MTSFFGKGLADANSPRRTCRQTCDSGSSVSLMLPSAYVLEFDVQMPGDGARVRHFFELMVRACARLNAAVCLANHGQPHVQRGYLIKSGCGMARKIKMHLMFEGVAEEAMRFYVSLFTGSEIKEITRAGSKIVSGFRGN